MIDRPTPPHVIEEIEHELEEVDDLATAAVPAWKRWARFIPLLVIVAGIALVFGTGLNRYLSLEMLQARRVALVQMVQAHPWQGLAIYMAAYVALVAFSIPGGMIATMTGGFLFGPWLGAAAAATAATTGATVLFLVARTALGGLLKSRAKAGGMVERVEQGVRTNAFSYLLVLRLIPAFPFWMCNICAGMVHIPLRTYVGATILGILPSTIIYASIGSGLGHVFEQGRSADLSILMSPQVIGPLSGLALLSFAPVALHAWRVRRARKEAAASNAGGGQE